MQLVIGTDYSTYKFIGIIQTSGDMVFLIHTKAIGILQKGR